MRLSFLRALDRWIGIFLLCLLALPVRIISFFVSSPAGKPRFVFLKLKGGGSLIIAMPALLGLRRRFPDAEFTLVCAREAKIYAELTGIFDNYLMIDDSSLPHLALSGLAALRSAFAATFCIDLEPNSWLAALFTLLSCATRRIGLVRPEQPARALAYSSAISFNAAAPIYVYYDRIAEMLNAVPAPAQECRNATQRSLPAAPHLKKDRTLIALAPFTSDFARERMMPAATWAAFLKKTYGDTPIDILIFGSARNKQAAAQMETTLRVALPAASIINLADSGPLAQSAAQMTQCDEVWAIDSGLLHIARLLGVPTRSFWGPTMPTQRLRPIDGLTEQVHYRPFLCSPCIQAAAPPCGGNNLCMISMAEESPNLRPSWVTTR